jgi:hypothetical protein
LPFDDAQIIREDPPSIVLGASIDLRKWVTAS